MIISLEVRGPGGNYYVIAKWVDLRDRQKTLAGLSYAFNTSTVEWLLCQAVTV